ncbi:GspH/FimT family pseudopilin [Marinobacterium rhizophilum]|uniref:Type II secretion system protein H n=1 Tax=Marinobacterium rhizophilum TaxID=420402 RepID=A0ABY5HFI9_9GAMM|nr:GspH/FimT family protein [Marinobacterium rhizophilum]UTW11112.1 GspH/FimT family protein [Marinobacterium rhizophilum]
MARENLGMRAVLLSRRRAGFTLIELLVVLAVLAVFVALGIPSFNSVFDRHRVTGAAQALYADLQYARAESIKRNIDVAVNFNTGAWCYGLTDTAPFSDCDCSTASAANCTVNGQQYIVTDERFPGVSMASSLSGGSVSFDPTRGTLSPSGNISFTGDAAEQVRVTTYFIGRVRLCSPTGYAGYKSC